MRPNYHRGGRRDYTKAVMSSLSVSTSFKVCMHLSASSIVSVCQVLLRVSHSYFYCVKSKIHSTDLDGKRKFYYLLLKALIGCGSLSQ